MPDRNPIESIEPQIVWRNFAELSKIPRGSGKEEQAALFVRDFGLSLGLKTEMDAIGNVVIHKPATASMKNYPIVALQSHLDMVQQKDDGYDFDFDKEAIRLIVEDDWIRSNHTTLGADNGIGVALSMAVLASMDIAHPQIEALFTVDEEVGMSGAEALTRDQLAATLLINLDMESDNKLTIGCAGAIDILVDATFNMHPLPTDGKCYEIEVRGGLGGHSGMDIHLGRMNAIKTLAQTLEVLNSAVPIILIWFSAEGVDNVIPRRARAFFSVSPSDEAALQTAIQTLPSICTPYLSREPNIRILCTHKNDTADRGFDPTFQQAFLQAIGNVHSGVHSMSPDVAGLVETSNNLAIVTASKGTMSATCLMRTCIESHKPDIIDEVRKAFAPLSAKIHCKADQPAWKPCADNLLAQLISSTYEDLYEEKPGIIAIHAGLECGIFSKTFPDMEMVSYGPNIEGAHSSHERVQISSVQKIWAILQKTLASIPPMKVI